MIPSESRTMITAHRTALSSAKQFFQKALTAGNKAVTNTDLHGYVMESTGQSRDVVHGTLDCTGPGTLIDAGWYTTHWHKERLDSGRVLHCRNSGAADVTMQREMNFDFPMKREACKKIMAHLPATGRPRLLTLASASGNCVKEAVARNANVVIDNVECRPDVLPIWQARKRQLGIETTDHLCTFQDFVKAPGFTDSHYAVINADVMGYPCKSMHAYLSTINCARNADIVAITTQYLEEFRNCGDFQDQLRKKYARSADKQGECIADWLSKYEMIDRFVYQKDEHSTRMEVFIFQLTPEVE